MKYLNYEQLENIENLALLAQKKEEKVAMRIGKHEPANLNEQVDYTDLKSALRDLNKYEYAELCVIETIGAFGYRDSSFEEMLEKSIDNEKGQRILVPLLGRRISQGIARINKNDFIRNFPIEKWTNRGVISELFGLKRFEIEPLTRKIVVKVISILRKENKNEHILVNISLEMH